MINNNKDKLIGNLRLQTNDLKEDIKQANKILSEISNLKTLNIGTSKIDTSSLKEELSLRKQSISEQLKQIENNDKLLQSQQKQSAEALKLYTQEKANSQQYANMSKILESTSGNSGLAMSSSNYGSSVLDRLKVSSIYAMSGQAIYSVRQAIIDAVQTNKDYESSLVDLKRILGNLNENELKQFGAEQIQYAKDFGISLSEVQKSYSALAAAGIGKEDLNSMGKTVMLGLNTSDIKDGAEMANLLTTSMKQLGISMSDSEKVLDQWNYLADRSVATTADYANAVSKAGATSKSIGVDFKELNAIVSVLSDRTGATGTEIGDAMKSLETRLLRPDTLKTLNEYGINVMKDANHFKSFGEIITSVSNTLNKFGDNTKQSNDILDALGGTMRKNWANILAANYSEVDAIKNSVGDDSIGYSAQKNATLVDTLEKKVARFNATVKELYLSLGNSGLLGQLKAVVDAGTWMAGEGSGFSSLLLTLGEVTVGVKTLSGALKILSGQNLKQWLDSTKGLGSLSVNSKLFNIDFGGATTSMKAYNAAVASVEASLKAGNITQEQSVAILESVRVKSGLATSSVNVMAAAENTLTEKVKLNKITQAEADLQLARLSQTMKVATVSTDAQTASEEALSAANKMTAASALGLNVEMIAITAALTFGISAIMSYIDYQKELKQQTEETKKAYNGLTTAMKKNDSSAIESNSNTLQEKQENYKAWLEKRTKAQEDLTKAQNNFNSTNPTSVKAMAEAQNAVEKANEAIQNQEKILNDNGIAFNKLTGEIYAVTAAQSRLEDNKILDGIKNTTNAEIDNKDQIIALYNEYNKLKSEQKDVGSVANVLAEKVSGVTVATDVNGKVVVQNTKLMDAEIKMLNTEGITVEDLTKAKIQAAKNAATAEVENTTMTYEQIKARINMYTQEASALGQIIDSQKGLQDAIKSTGIDNVVTQGLNDIVNKSGQDLLNKKNSQLSALNDAANAIDVIYNNAYSAKPDSNSGYPYDSGKKSGGSNSAAKQENAALILKDRYYELNQELLRTQNLLDENKALQEDASTNNYIKEKINLQQIELDLLKQKQEAENNLLTEEKKERQEVVNTLKSRGVSFSGVGDAIAPLNAQIILQQKLDALNSHRNDKDKTYYNQLKTEYDDFNTSLTRFFTIQNTEIPKINSEYQSLATTITKTSQDIKKECSDILKSMLQVEEANAKSIVELNNYDGMTKDAWTKANQKAQNAIQDRIDAINAVADAESEVEQRLQNQKDLMEKQVALENAKKNLNRQTIMQNPDGTYQFRYVADADAVKTAQKAVDDQIKSNNKWEEDTAKQHQIKLLEQQKKALADEQQAKDEAYSQDIAKIDEYYKNMDKLVSDNMDTLNKTFGNKWDAIISNIQSKVDTANALQAQLNLTMSTINGTNGYTGVKPSAQAQTSINANNPTSSDHVYTNSDVNWAQSSTGVWTATDKSTGQALKNVTFQDSTGNGLGKLDSNGEWTTADGYFDDGGLAVGLGYMPKDIIKPERVLSPTQTENFNKLTEYTPSILSDLNSIMDKISMINVSDDSGNMTFQFGDLTLPNVTNGETFVRDLRSLAWQKLKTR